MNILHLSYSSSDGAGNAARRLHEALGLIPNVRSEFLYYKPFHLETSRISWVEKKINGLTNILINKVIKSESFNILPTSLLTKINQSDADIVHLHWINAEMISIGQIGRIQKPLVWTFHDMWPVCGSEHYVSNNLYIDGYGEITGNTIGERMRAWLHRWVWRRKLVAFSGMQCHVLTPGTWMTDCASRSFLFKYCTCETLFNGLDTDIFKPLPNKKALRRKYGIPEEKIVILFGACKPTENRKGWDLLVQALEQLEGKNKLCLVVFGRSGSEQIAGFQTIWLGRIEGESAMTEVYNCADVMCVPSRQETFGQTASEPQACGIPVVAFNATGLMDVVEHKVTGYLADPFDPRDFCNGIEWVLDADQMLLSSGARERALALFDQRVIAESALHIYQTVLERRDEACN